MMGSTYSGVQDSSFEKYCFSFSQKCWRIYKSPYFVPPPFTLIAQIIYFPVYLIRKYVKYQKRPYDWKCFYCQAHNFDNPEGTLEILNRIKIKYKVLLPGFYKCCSSCHSFKKVMKQKDEIYREISCWIVKAIGLPVSVLYYFASAGNRNEENIETSSLDIIHHMYSSRALPLNDEDFKSDKPNEFADEFCKSMIGRNPQKRKDLWLQHCINREEVDLANQNLIDRFDNLEQAIDEIRRKLLPKM
jgi:hypothetical protein